MNELISKISKVLGIKPQKMSEITISVLIMPENLLLNGEIYTAGKNFTLPPVVPIVTILTSVFTVVALFHTGYTAQIALEQKGYYAYTYDVAL